MKFRTVLKHTAPVAVVIALVPGWQPASAQTAIAVLAGYLQYSEGDVAIAGKPVQHDPAEMLHVQEGERLTTATGRAEVMLIPDGFLRLGRDSEMEMLYAGLARATVRMHSGSAIVDLFAVPDRDAVQVLVGDTEVRFPKPGVYRIDVPSAGETTLRVFKGRAMVSRDGHTQKVKAKRLVVLGQGDLAAGKFDPSETDDLGNWSGQRAAVLAKARPRKTTGDGNVSRGSARWESNSVGGIF